MTALIAKPVTLNNKINYHITFLLIESIFLLKAARRELAGTLNTKIQYNNTFKPCHSLNFIDFHLLYKC